MKYRSWWSPDEVTLTHIPTGLKAVVESAMRSGPRGTWEATQWARKIIAGKLAKRVEDPAWKDCAKSIERVRSYHLHTYFEIPQFVQNQRTGNRFPIDGVLEGKIDELLKDNAT